MYATNPTPLTFADLSKAMQQDAGLGQLTQDSLDNLPLTGQVGESPLDQAISNAPITAAANPGIPWGTLALVGVVGLVLFSVGKRG